MDKMYLRKQHVVVAEPLETNVIASLSALRLNATIRNLGAVRTSAAASSPKASCSKPPGPEELGKDEWQRRAKKRQEGAAAVKKRTKKDNLNATELFEGGGGYPARPRPRTPDPTDSTVSNREEWEKGAQPWRKDLQRLAAGASQTRHPGPQRGAAWAQVDVHSPRAADLGGESEHVAGTFGTP